MMPLRADRMIMSVVLEILMIDGVYNGGNTYRVFCMAALSAVVW